MTKYSDTAAAIRQTDTYAKAKDALGFISDEGVLDYASDLRGLNSYGPAQTQAIKDELRDRALPPVD